MRPVRVGLRALGAICVYTDKNAVERAFFSPTGRALGAFSGTPSCGLLPKLFSLDNNPKSDYCGAP